MMVRSYVLGLALLVMLCVWTTLNIVGKMLRALSFGNFDFVAGLKCYSVADRVAISLHTGSFNLRFDSVIVFTKCHLEAFFGVCSVVSNLPVVSEHYALELHPFTGSVWVVTQSAIISFVRGLCVVVLVVVVCGPC